MTIKRISRKVKRDFISFKRSIKSPKKYSEKETDKKILSYVKEHNEK